MGSLRPVLLSNGEIAERYRAGVPLITLAMTAKTSPDIIKRILTVQGVTLRSPTEARRLAVADQRARRESRRRRLVALGLRQDD